MSTRFKSSIEARLEAPYAGSSTCGDELVCNAALEMRFHIGEMELNRRQMLAWEYAGRNGSITSKELMDILGGSISKRTASYDIQDLVNRGLLTKVGRGPATRYVRTVQKRSA